ATIALVLGGGKLFRFLEGGFPYHGNKLIVRDSAFTSEQPYTMVKEVVGAPGNVELAFKDVTRELGLDYHFQEPRFLDEHGHRVVFPPSRLLFFAPGIAVADFNNDGYMDFFVVNSDPEGESALYLNDGHGHFVNRAREWGV